MKDNEVYHALIGKTLGSFWIATSLGDDSEGTPTRVAFDWQKIMDREDTHGDIIGFYHTHPSFPGYPSSIDYATMQGWVLSLGRPLLCLIEGTDGLNANWFDDCDHAHIKGTVWRIGKYFFGTIPKFD